MKKILMSGIAVLSFLGMTACESNQTNTAADGDDKVVVDRDSVATEYEVTETVVDYDTTKRTETVDVEVDKDTDTKIDYSVLKTDCFH